MLQLKNIFDLTFKREFELTHGSLDAPNIPGEYCLKDLHEMNYFKRTDCIGTAALHEKLWLTGK